MYTLERANLIACRTMGRQHFLNTVRQQNRGVIHGGDADANMGDEEGKKKCRNRMQPFLIWMVA